MLRDTLSIYTTSLWDASNLLERWHVRLVQSSLRLACVLAWSSRIVAIIICRVRWRFIVLAITHVAACSSLWGREVVIEYDIIVILRHVVMQVKVLAKEAHQLMTGPIIGDESWLWVHVLKHDIEKSSSMTSSLRARVNEEIKDGKRFHLVHLTWSSSHEQLFVANLYEADAATARWPHEDNVPVCLEFAQCCDRRWQFLGLKLKVKVCKSSMSKWCDGLKPAKVHE